MGVAVSPPEKNLDFALRSPKEVISLSEEDLATLRCGPRFMCGGDNGGLRSSGILAPMFGKVIWAAEGEVHGSDDSLPVQAKL